MEHCTTKISSQNSGCEPIEVGVCLDACVCVCVHVYACKSVCTCLRVYTRARAFVRVYKCGSDKSMNIHIYPTPPLGQKMTQGQFLSGGLNSEFFSS